MAKETYYFSHDFSARNDPKLQKVLMKLGQEGKGVFWDLVEMLYEQGGRLLLSECDSYAFALRTNSECILSLINDFGLFVKDADCFWSESVNRRLKQRSEKSDKARQSAMNRWNNDANASKENANALRIESEGNAIKEKKVKKRKTNDIKKEDIPKDVSSELFNEVEEKKPIQLAIERYLEMRVKKKVIPTEHALELVKKKVWQYANKDEVIAVKIFDQSTINNWTDVFPLKQDNLNKKPNVHTTTLPPSTTGFGGI